MDILIFFIIILIASVLQTSTGFGFSILATPFLLLLFEPREAIQINLILSLIISVALFSKIKHEIDFGIVKRFIIGSSIGVVAGIFIFLMLNVSSLKLIVSMIILLLTLLLILNFRIKRSSQRDIIVGTVSGALTTSIGMPGPPLLLYFSGTATEKGMLRGTTLAFYLYIYLISLIFQFLFTGTTKDVWISSALALPLVIIGLFIGQFLFKLLNQKLFQMFTYGILLFTGFYLLFNH